MNQSDLDAIMAETLWHIDAEADKDGWDQRPELYAILTNPVTDGVGVIELKPAPGWDQCLDANPDPPRALEILTRLLRIAPKELKRGAIACDRLYGLALVVEVWMLRATSVKEVFAAADISKHPNRIETRFIYCMSAEGKLVALNHEREGIVQRIDNDSVTILDGAIPELLLACIKELKA